MTGPSPQREMRKAPRPNERPSFSVLMTAPSKLMTAPGSVKVESHDCRGHHQFATGNSVGIPNNQEFGHCPHGFYHDNWNYIRITNAR